MLGSEAFETPESKPRREMLGERIDLTTIDTSERRPFLPGARRFLRAGVPVILFGPRGSGKSLVALLGGEQIIAAGGSVAYIDLENGPRRMAERLSAILDERDEESWQAVGERLAYYPRVRLTKATPEGWAEALGEYTVVVVDSLARALGQLGLDENSTPDFTRFVVDFVDPLTARGVAVVMLDNTGWSEAERSRGASGKWDLVELVYRVSSDEIAPNCHGHIRLQRKRTRDGDEAVLLEAGVGGGTYTRLEVADPDQDNQNVLETAIAILRAGGHIDPGTSLGFSRLTTALRERGVKAGRKLRGQLSEAASDPETALRKQSEGRSSERGFYVDLDVYQARTRLDVNQAGTRRYTSSTEYAENSATTGDLDVDAVGTRPTAAGRVPTGAPKGATSVPARENDDSLGASSGPSLSAQTEENAAVLQEWIRSLSALPEAEAEAQWKAREAEEASVSANHRPPPPRIALSVEEACASLGVSWDTFHTEVEPGLRVIRLGRRKLFAVAELERWCEEHAERTLP